VVGRQLLALPKAELHLHLHGAMRPATVAELSAATGLTVTDPRAFTDFAGFQVIYRAARACVTRPEHLGRVIAEVVEDAAADGVVWVQPHFDPYAYPEFGPAERVLDLAVTAGWEAGARHRIGFGLTVAAMRHHGPDAAVQLARFAAEHTDHGVHAFGLAGDEAAFPIEPFAPAFAIARDAGLTAAPHAGEMAGPCSVRAAVELLGARRVAHGIRAIEDPGTVELLRRHDVSLDVSPSSNQALGIVPSLADHPLPALLDAGVACTLGADDPLLFGTSLHGEYELARTQLGLTDQQLAALARTSITTSNAPPELISSAMRSIDDWLAEPADCLPADDRMNSTTDNRDAPTCNPGLDIVD
jgi:adenosine deaminase